MRMPVSWMKSLSESFSQPFGTPLAMSISCSLTRPQPEVEIIPAGAPAAPRKNGNDRREHAEACRRPSRLRRPWIGFGVAPSLPPSLRSGERRRLFPLPGELPLRLFLLRGRSRRRRLLVLGRGDQRKVGRFVLIRRRLGGGGRRSLDRGRKDARRRLGAADELGRRLLDQLGLRLGLARLDLRLGDGAERRLLHGDFL